MMHQPSLLARSLLGLSVMCCLALGVPRAHAQMPHLIRYQGQAMDSSGVPLEGPYTLTFRLYDAATAGNKLWEEQQPGVPLSKGHFSVLLGQVTSLTSIDWSKACWLSVQINTDPELSPRQQITSVPLAMRAEAAEQLTQPITPALITPQGSGSGLDADTVDGKHASDLVKTNDTAGGDLSGTYPNPTVSKINGRDASGDVGFGNIQVFTSSGTWTKPAGVTRVYVKVWGGGGGGGEGGNASGQGNNGTSGGNSSFPASGGTVQGNGGSGGPGGASGSPSGVNGGSGVGGAWQLTGQASNGVTIGVSGPGTSGGLAALAPLTYGSGGSGGAGTFKPGVGGGGGGYAEGIVSVAGNVTVTVGSGGAGGSGSGANPGGSGGGGLVIVYY